MSQGMCDACRKRPARLRYTEIKDNRKTEMNLCEDCAAEKGLGLSPTPGEGEMTASDILAGMVEENVESEESGTLVCPECSLTYAEFKQTGRLGCPGCYESFRVVLEPLLRKIHGSTRHTGKGPRGSGRATEGRMVLREKRSALRMAIEREDYEAAARLRDECQELERKISREVGEPRRAKGNG